VEVAIKLDIPQAYATQFHLEYLKLKGLDVLLSLYGRTRGKLFPLCKLFEELVVKRGMSIEQIANIVDIALHKLPYMESLFEIAKKEADRMQEKSDCLSKDIISLRKELIELEEEKQRRIHALPSYHYPYYELPYSLSALPDLSTQYRNNQEEIQGVDKGDIAD
jgi:hypothetical protein